MAQASRAITPKDPGGPWGQRIGVNVVGSDARTVRVTAFVTKRKNSSDWWRYSIVVLNWYVPAILRFRDSKRITVAGWQARYRQREVGPTECHRHYRIPGTAGTIPVPPSISDPHHWKSQATFTFPVGLTTLWWYAPPSDWETREGCDGLSDINYEDFSQEVLHVER